MAITVTVDDNVCISSGRCVADLPDVFRFDEDEIAEVKPDAALPGIDELVALARLCPSSAIQVAVDGQPLDVG